MVSLFVPLPVLALIIWYDAGIEELFLQITRRLVERKAKIENDRVLRSRDSIMLHDAVPTPTTPTTSWCC